MNCRPPLEPLVQGTRLGTALMGNAAFLMTTVQNKHRLRSSLKVQRQVLSDKQLSQASFALSRHARTYRQLFNCAKILSYSPSNGEIDPQALLETLNAHIFLPRITHFRNRSMQFFPRGVALELNRFGIAEPRDRHASLPARSLDAALLPLVAFDRSGNRLGMGAGYYDRKFSFKAWKNAPKRPLLIGLAYGFQEVNSLVADSWDIPLDAIITDQELILV